MGTKRRTSRGKTSKAVHSHEHHRFFMDAEQISGDHLKNLGIVIVVFGYLEETVKLFIATLLGTGQGIASILTAPLSFRTSIDVLGSLYTKRSADDPEAVKKFNRLLGRALQAEELRNRTIHSRWLVGDPKPVVLRVKVSARRPRGLAIQHERVAPEAIYGVAMKIGQVNYDLSVVLRDALPRLGFPTG